MEAREVLFAPSIYEHAARVVGRTPWDVSRDADLMARAHIEAYRLYEHRPIVVGIDIYNLEAEAYGAKIEKPSGNGIPAITSHRYSTAKELRGLEPFDPRCDGRIPMVIDVAKRVAEECPDADVRVPLSGPFSLATNLMGFENISLYDSSWYEWGNNRLFFPVETSVNTLMGGLPGTSAQASVKGMPQDHQKKTKAGGTRSDGYVSCGG